MLRRRPLPASVPALLAAWALLAGWCVPAARAQAPVRAPEGRQLQVGLGVVPSAGLQVGYVALRSFYSQEFILTADVSPWYGGRRGNVQLSGSLGGSIRILGIERTLGNAGYRGYDLDVGVRFGPALLFAFRETRFTKNQRFSLFLELFGRFTTTIGDGITLFAEAGFHRPAFRGGLWFSF